MMKENIGYPDYIEDDKLLDNEFKDVSIHAGSIMSMVSSKIYFYLGAFIYNNTRWGDNM